VNSLPSKTVANRGPAAHQNQKKKDSAGKKWKVPSTPVASESSQPRSKKARVEDVDDDGDQGPSSSATTPTQPEGVKVKVCELAIHCMWHLCMVFTGIGEKKSNLSFL